MEIETKPPKPMLAAKCPALELLQDWPYLLQHKVDGIRCLISGGKAWSRSGKLLPNKLLQDLVREERWTEGLDGELVYRGDYSATVSAIMTRDFDFLAPGNEGLKYIVFDNWRRDYVLQTTKNRVLKAKTIPSHSLIRICWVKEFLVSEPEDIRWHINREEWIQDSPEGYILRRLGTPYKHGRSTMKEGFLMKAKNFETDEAIIVGTIPLYTNNNEAEKDAFGYQKRSTHKEHKKEEDLLGALVCTYKGKQFNVGTGFDMNQRESLWKERDSLIGKMITFEHLPTGAQDLPRFPVFKGFRDPIDTDIDININEGKDGND